jgi:protein ImuB
MPNMVGLRPAESPGSRRIAAIVLPELLCEIANATHWPHAHLTDPCVKRRSPPPLGVVLFDPTDAETVAIAEPQPRETTRIHQQSQTLKATAKLDAVNFEARRFGVREGQTITEASAILTKLLVCSITAAQVRAALGRVAEIALAFGPTVALSVPDTVWIDITGAGHLMGGEAALAQELTSRVRAIGHMTRVAIAGGPRLARAFARFSDPTCSTTGESSCIVPPEHTLRELERLPLAALPLEPEAIEWFVRLGVLSVGALAALPRASAAARLGKNAGSILDLCHGHDPEPLVAYEPPQVLVEQTTWDEGVNGSEALLFVLRGLASRISARLSGRGEAAQKLCVTIECDKTIARLRDASPCIALDFELAAPLWREQEITRVVASRLERQRLESPSIGLHLKAYALTAADGQQLDFSRVASGLTTDCRGLEELPVLLAELNADIGKEQVGVLALTDSLRPENKCTLVPPLAKNSRTRAEAEHQAAERWPNAPTRLLRKPVPLAAALRIGETLAIDRHLYTIESIHFEQRLDAVEWWSPAPVARDYLRLWLACKSGGLEAIVYVDRKTGTRFLQAIAD